MVEVGRLLAQRGAIVLTGGFGGSGMEAPARGAKEAGGRAIGYTMLDKPGNEFLTDEIDCSTQLVKRLTIPLGSEELEPELQYGIRLGNLLIADGFILGADGGLGTMVELLAIMNLNSKFWATPKRLAVLKIPLCSNDKWNVGTIALRALVDQETPSPLSIVDKPKTAVDWVLEV